MKKLKFVFLFLIIPAFCKTAEQDFCFSGAITAGYLFKIDDCVFKEVYGKGIANLITIDGCYYRWQPWGIGAKVSYLRTHGRTAFLRQKTTLQEIPITFYIRRIKDLDCGLQLYASLGAGVAILREKSYLGKAHFNAGIGEIEVGFNYSKCRCFGLTGALRYIFPSQKQCCTKLNVGGFDLRAGIEFQY